MFELHPSDKQRLVVLLISLGWISAFIIGVGA